VCNLHRIETLGGKHLLLKQELRLLILHQLRLTARVLEVAKGANGLVHRSASAVTRLERRGIGGLVHVEVAHVLGLVVLSRLLRGVVLGLPPVALEVARRCAAMTLATTALEVRLTRLVGVGVVVVVVCGRGAGAGGRIRGRSRERESRTATASTSSTTTDSHTLAAAMATATTTKAGIVGCAVTARARIAVGASAGAREGELEARSLSLLLSQFGRLLGIGEG
jgi:hypothetical protein